MAAPLTEAEHDALRERLKELEQRDAEMIAESWRKLAASELLLKKTFEKI